MEEGVRHDLFEAGEEHRLIVEPAVGSLGHSDRGLWPPELGYATSDHCHHHRNIVNRIRHQPRQVCVTYTIRVSQTTTGSDTNNSVNEARW